MESFTIGDELPGRLPSEISLPNDRIVAKEGGHRHMVLSVTERLYVSTHIEVRRQTIASFIVN